MLTHKKISWTVVWVSVACLWVAALISPDTVLPGDGGMYIVCWFATGAATVFWCMEKGGIPEMLMYTTFASLFISRLVYEWLKYFGVF